VEYKIKELLKTRLPTYRWLFLSSNRAGLLKNDDKRINANKKAFKLECFLYLPWNRRLENNEQNNNEYKRQKPSYPGFPIVYC